MRLLALDAALDECSAVLGIDGVIVAEAVEPCRHGQAERLPRLVAGLLAGDRRLDIVAVTIGPGRFTGLRAAIALAEGLAIAASARAVGVTVPAAIRQAVKHQDCWVALPASRDRLYLDRGAAIELLERADWPLPAGQALAGDAAGLLAANATDVAILSATGSLARAVAELAMQQSDITADDAAHHPALMPLYIDAPAIKQAVTRPPPTEAA